MVWVSLFIVFILIVTLLSGLKEGAVRHLFNLMAELIAIPVAGMTYGLLAGLLYFLPGDSWQNFLGFFITFGIVVALVHIAAFVPQRTIRVIWKEGLFYRLLGGAFNIVNASIGFVVFARVLSTYPIFDWLAQWVAGSSVMSFLVQTFGFVQALLPKKFQSTVSVFSIIL